jgi:hypothetical protein
MICFFRFTNTKSIKPKKMKKIIVLAMFTLSSMCAIAQTCGYPANNPLQPNQPAWQQANSFPASGHVGLNTGALTPGAPLHIIGRTNRAYVELMRLQMYNTVGSLVANTTWKIGIAYGTANSVNYSCLSFQSPTCTGMTTQFMSNGDLLISGKLIAPEVFVTTSIPWADYVFKPEYKLRPLSEVNSYIGLHGHLPGMPSAQEIGQQGGFEVARLNVLLLEKVEELTLYSIQQDKLVQQQQQTISTLEQKVLSLEQRIQALETKK